MENKNLRSVDQTKPLIEYIEKNVKKGYKLEDLKWALISQGYSRTAVQKAVDYIQKNKKTEEPRPVKVEAPKEESIPMNIEMPEPSLWEKFKGFFS
ncbi:hypothetical protein A3K73_04975 [Candidatus Pacearchaeota archaeon RBG_13_36_9]|nr:MAG: hypothetical protein A3K73_04975 [Candidatus Pacearchaeota archaeon RBG_13_36_9]